MSRTRMARSRQGFKGVALEDNNRAVHNCCRGLRGSGGRQVSVPSTKVEPGSVAFVGQSLRVQGMATGFK
jgi:hypothetical protein